MRYLALFLLTTTLHATQLRPWLDDDLVPIFRAQYDLQQYNQVAIRTKETSYHSTDNFVTGSLRGAYSPVEVEVEGCFGATAHHNFNWDEVLLTGRYQVLNDITSESPVSWTLGFTYSRGNEWTLHDVSIFRHGRVEYLAHTSIGKESPLATNWSSRAWGAAVLGITDETSSWLFLKAAFEMNRCDNFAFGIFIDGLFGFGKQTIDLVNFQGYGPVAHRTVDLGIWTNYGGWEVQYSYRILQQNAPAYVHYLQIAYNFSLNL